MLANCKVKMEHEPNNHPVTALPEVIDEHGLMVFDDVHRMPVYGEPFTTSYMTIALNLQGWVRAECDMRPVCFRRHGIAVLTPRHVLCPIESSADYHAMLIVMSVPFREEMKRLYPEIYADNFHYVHQPDIPLTEPQFVIVQQLFKALHVISEMNSPHRWKMLGNLLEVLFLLLRDYRKENGISERTPSPQEKLFNRFYQAITENYRQSREVRFYANLLNLTPKHFTTIIKQHTGANALEWINGYVLNQAKIMLRHRRELTIQEITQFLGFSDQASFTRFFKTHEGISPTKYREKG